MNIYFCKYCGTYTILHEGSEKSCSSCGRMDLLEQVTLYDLETRREKVRQRYNKAHTEKVAADKQFERVTKSFKEINQTIINYLKMEEQCI
jgi:ribosomal protein L32